ncbi:hypothetical protein BL254_22620 [Protofrankia sp. BMG5.30]|nr:hypothetical protein BL254_22620 [Protofrankia sp. BMG5.30]
MVDDEAAFGEEFLDVPGRTGRSTGTSAPPARFPSGGRRNPANADVRTGDGRDVGASFDHD